MLIFAKPSPQLAYFHVAGDDGNLSRCDLFRKVARIGIAHRTLHPSSVVLHLDSPIFLRFHVFKVLDLNLNTHDFSSGKQISI